MEYIETSWGATVNPFTVSGLLMLPFRSESKVTFEWGGTCKGVEGINNSG